MSPQRFRCESSICRTVYPIVDGVPILIDEKSSIFRTSEIERHEGGFFRNRSRLHRAATTVLPDLTQNIGAAKRFAQFKALTSTLSDRPMVLVIGGGVMGRGMGVLATDETLDLIETDIFLAPRAAIVCDAHQLPFADGTFDGVIAQAVLEHVVDPYRCVDQIHRVLKHGGVVYAETPFMQQVHGGAYDFTRFTFLGHRRLFRRFGEVASGAVAGTGAALAWSIEYFALSFARGNTTRAAIRAMSRLTCFWLPLFDRLLINRPMTLDGASGYFFLGRRQEDVLADRDLLGLYWNSD